MIDSHAIYYVASRNLLNRLQNNEGGVGSTRECVSDKGIVKQNILEWEPDQKLKFELRETNIYFGPCVESIVETFEIKQINQFQSSIKRTTEFTFKSLLKPFISIPMFIGLKSIHRYVFRNWYELSEKGRIELQNV